MEALRYLFALFILFLIAVPFIFIWQFKKTKNEENMLCASFSVFVQTFVITFLLGFYSILHPELKWWIYVCLIMGVVISAIMLGFTFRRWNKLYAGLIGLIGLWFIGFSVVCMVSLYTPSVIRGHSFTALEHVVSGFKNYRQLDSRGQLALAFKLKPALKHDDKYVKMGALIILETFGKNVAPAADELIELIENRDKEIQLKAIEIIPQIGSPAKKVIPNFIKTLSEPSDSKYWQEYKIHGIARALRSMKEESCYRLLVDCLLSDNELLAENAVRVLQKTGVSGDIIVPDLLKMLKNEKMDIRINALEVLKYVSTKRKQEVLAALSEFSKTVAPKEKKVLKEALGILEYK